MTFEIHIAFPQISCIKGIKFKRRPINEAGRRETYRFTNRSVSHLFPATARMPCAVSKAKGALSSFIAEICITTPTINRFTLLHIGLDLPSALQPTTGSFQSKRRNIQQGHTVRNTNNDRQFGSFTVDIVATIFSSIHFSKEVRHNKFYNRQAYSRSSSAEESKSSY